MSALDPKRTLREFLKSTHCDHPVYIVLAQGLRQSDRPNGWGNFRDKSTIDFLAFDIAGCLPVGPAGTDTRRGEVRCIALPRRKRRYRGRLHDRQQMRHRGDVGVPRKYGRNGPALRAT